MSTKEELPLSSQKIMEGIYNEKPDEHVQYHEVTDLYFAVCQRITKELHLRIKKPSIDLTQNVSANDYLQLVADENNLRVRKIHLSDDWGNYDYGPLILFHNHNIYALITNKKSEYEIIDFKEGTKKKLTPDFIKNADKDAYIFYQTLEEKRISPKELLSFTFWGLKADFIKVFTCQILMNILLLALPVFTSILFDEVIPNASFSLLGEYAGLVVATAFIVLLMQVLQNIGILQLKIKAQYKLQVGVWDRIIRLPLSFFKQYAVGDLAKRGRISQVLQERITNQSITSIMSGFMSLLYLGLMLYIDVYITLIIFFISAIMLLFSVIIYQLIFKENRRIGRAQLTVYAKVLNFVNSIIKLRVAHKEKAAFDEWGKEVGERILAKNQVNKLQAKLNVLDVGFMGITTLILYSLVIWQGDRLSFPDFIILNAAFNSYIAAFRSSLSVVAQSVEIIPLFNQIKPFLNCLPEDTGNKNKPVDLSGDIVMSNIVFRYPESDKLLFVDFNLTIKAGSFTAIVGTSGSGKSSILRLILGLEQPESGDIKYSGINLNNLQMAALRSKIGVVMQSANLLPGSIFENMAGKNHALTREEAWKIAEQVGLKDTIRDLAMGMDTPLSDGIPTFSGGEIQRLNLARALGSVTPQILMLDEATSALDNKVQHQIYEYLNQLKVTRIIIAHRLSTIRDADIIHVLDKGVLVESGTFDELIARKGAFYHLAQGKSAESP